MAYQYVTVDVFTAERFCGNPLAVVLGAQGLSRAQMQAIATEFNYAETTFVLPPADAAHTAQVRIFTPVCEVPFAGHPNVGTALVTARDLAARGLAVPPQFVFEEAAGLVPIRLLHEGGEVVGAEFTAPEPLSTGATLTAAQAAACLSLAPGDIVTAVHPPIVASVGLAFLVVELATRQALAAAQGDLAVHRQLLPPLGTDAVYAYVRGAAHDTLEARTFAPLDKVVEDPATGSATAAAIALLTSLSPRDGERDFRARQGEDMGRPSVLSGRTRCAGGRLVSVHVGGRAVVVMRGVLEL